MSGLRQRGHGGGRDSQTPPRPSRRCALDRTGGQLTANPSMCGGLAGDALSRRSKLFATADRYACPPMRRPWSRSPGSLTSCLPACLATLALPSAEQPAEFSGDAGPLEKRSADDRRNDTPSRQALEQASSVIHTSRPGRGCLALHRELEEGECLFSKAGVGSSGSVIPALSLVCVSGSVFTASPRECGRAARQPCAPETRDGRARSSALAHSRRAV
jgi:hypothetical protein